MALKFGGGQAKNIPSHGELMAAQKAGADYRVALQALVNKTKDPDIKQALDLADKAANAMMRYLGR
jgi:hypothetical protein